MGFGCTAYGAPLGAKDMENTQFVHNLYPREAQIRREQGWIRCGEAAPRASGKAPRGHRGQDEGTEDTPSTARGTEGAHPAQATGQEHRSSCLHRTNSDLAQSIYEY